MERYDEILLLMNRWLAQIVLVAPGGHLISHKAVTGWQISSVTRRSQGVQYAGRWQAFRAL